MITITLLLVVGAFIVTVASAMNKCPLWPAVVLICVALLLRSLPVG
jgi:hypothetical protein